MSAYLECDSDSECLLGRNNSIRATIDVVDDDEDGIILSYKNEDGDFVGDGWLAPPGRDKPLEAGMLNNSSQPTGCYVNLSSNEPFDEQGPPKTGSLSCNRAESLYPCATKIRPKICYANDCGDLIPDDNSYIYYL